MDMKRKIYLTAAVCLLCLSQAQAQAQNFNINAGSVTITTNGTYTITGTGEPTTNTITVNSGVDADITLENVNIDVSGIENACAFNMTGATVTLRLSNVNTLKSGNSYAGLQAPSGSTLAIKRLEDNGSCGVLNATGGEGGAGIGGAGSGDRKVRNSGLIFIYGGIMVNATGGSGGAGIGGGIGGDNRGISISSGTVNATGGSGGAGIGGGVDGDSYRISIYGGTVTATGGESGVGLGSDHGVDGLILLIDATVVAIAGSGVAIGGCYGIHICNGTIIATGSGIGIGADGETPITITGKPVIFATAINRTLSSNPKNGIATGDDVNINPSTKTITLYTDFAVPTGAKLAFPTGWTLNTNGSKTKTTYDGAVRSAAAQQDVTGISTVDESSPVTVRFLNKILYIDSPAAEQIEVYSISGNLLHKASKRAGEAFFVISHPERILIVGGSSGWKKKIETGKIL
jgi:hypothetical protein